jgi:L-asparaginase
MNEKKKILILHTGGTFGRQLNKTNSPEEKNTTYLENLMQCVPELASIAEIELHILCNIDSSDASCELWTLLAKTICDKWDSFDGFVVIHGTDTMAWSACALAFFLGNLTKSIVFTGSQRPLAALRSDARVNIIDSVELASHGIPEIMLCFDSKIHRATRVTKYSNTHLQAFKSPNSPILGEFGVHIKISQKLLRSVVPESKRHVPSFNPLINTKVTTLRCVPGVPLQKEFIDTILSFSSGILVQGFGAGNLPLEDESWKILFGKALDLKIPVVMSTQCEAGYVSLDLYENGKIFEKLGAISAMDMTFEAATIKLMIMLGRKIAFEKRHDFFATALAYECMPLSQKNSLDES